MEKNMRFSGITLFEIIFLIGLFTVMIWVFKLVWYFSTPIIIGLIGYWLYRKYQKGDFK